MMSLFSEQHKSNHSNNGSNNNEDTAQKIQQPPVVCKESSTAPLIAMPYEKAPEPVRDVTAAAGPSTPLPINRTHEPLPPSSLALSLQASFDYHVQSSSSEQQQHQVQNENLHGVGAVGDPASPSAPLSQHQERNVMVTELFGRSVGDCLGEFHARYYRIPGKFFVATRALLFYSNWLGFERRFCLTFHDIDAIQSYRSTSIKISMVDCEEYVFKKFQDRDAVVLVLQELLMRYQVEIEKGEDLAEPPVIPRAFHQSAIGFTDDDITTSRQMEDVSMLSTSPGDFEVDENFQRPHLSSEHAPRKQHLIELGDGQPNRRRSMSVPSLVGQGETRQHVVPSRTAAYTNDTVVAQPNLPKTPPPSSFAGIHHAQSTGKINKKQNTTLGHTPSRNARTNSCHSESGGHNILDGSRQQLFAHPIAPPPQNAHLSSLEQSQYADLFEIWLKQNKSHQQIALQPIELTLTPLEFFNLFFHDEAPHSLSKYQTEKIGDKEVQFSSWRSAGHADNANVIVLERNIDYVHPLNNAMGPSEAKTSRRQTLWQYGDHAIVIQNITSVDGIPMADCFEVHDQWIIVRKTDGVNVGAMTLSVSFEVDFVKRTMFKSMIQKNVKAETKKWFQGYLQMLQNAIKEHRAISGASMEVESDQEVAFEKTILEFPEEASLELDGVATRVVGTAAPTLAERLRWDVILKVILVGILLILLFHMYFLQARLSKLELQVSVLGAQTQDLLQLLNRESGACVGVSGEVNP